MKKSKFIYLPFLAVLLFNTLKGQGNLGDSVQYVCPVSLAFLMTPPTQNNITSATTPQSAFSSSAIIICGNFRLYYEDLQQQSGDGFDDPVLGLVRRNTICAALSYIQSVINIPVPVDIHVDRSYTSGNPAPLGTTYAAFAGPVFKSGTLGVLPGFFGGNLFDHITSGIDPDAADFDAYSTFNFHQTYYGNSPYPVSYWDDYLNTSPSCRTDLFSLALHEFSHALGFFSGVGEDGSPNNFLSITSNTSGIGSFSKFDKHFLFYGDPRTPATFVNQQLVDNTTNPPSLNSLLSPQSNLLRNFTNTANTKSIWVSNSGAPNNYKVYDGYWYKNNIAMGGAANLMTGSFLSHLDNGYLAMYRGGQVSPGFQPTYVMSPAIYANQRVRSWSIQELRMFITMGYSLNPAFASSTSLSTNGSVTNSFLIASNSPPHRTTTTDLVRFPLASSSDYYTAALSPETKPVDYTITNLNIPGGTAAPMLTINTHTRTDIADLNNDPVGVYPNSIYGVRGVTTGGNNHNCIVLTNSHTIVYTPPPGFYGRAEFGFNLWDGKEKGAAKIITIEVLGNFVIPPGNELVINGSFEDATEVKTVSNPTAAISSYIDGHITELHYGAHQSGGHPYIASNVGGSFYASGIARKESYRYCWGLTSTVIPAMNPEGFGNELTSVDLNMPNNWVNGAPPMPVSTGTAANECYSGVINYWTNTSSYMGNVLNLMSPLQTCRYYRFEFDASQNPNYSNYIGSIMQCSLMAVTNLTAVLSPSNAGYPAFSYNLQQSIPIDYTISSVSSTSNTNWQRVAIDFVYCGSPTRTLIIQPLWQSNFLKPNVVFNIDNISLKQHTIQPPPLIVTATNSNTLFCPGSTATLTGHALNSSCATTFTWRPMSIINSTIVVNPPTATTAYTLLANDLCRTGSAVVSAAPLPIGTFSVPPVCIGSLSQPLTNYLPAGTPTNGLFSGLSLSYINSVFYLDLRPSQPIFSTFVGGVQNYTYTTFLPGGCTQNYTFSVLFIATPTISATSACIFPGQSVTLSAIPSVGSFTWAPATAASANASSLIVNPVVTTAYVFLYNNGLCSGRGPKFDVHVITPVTFTNLPSTLCSFQNISYLNNFLATGVPLTGTWSASGGIGIITGTAGTSAQLFPALPAGIYTVSYTYSAMGAPCTASNQFTFNLITGFNLTTVGPAMHCGNLNIPSSITATSTTGGLTFTWLPGYLSGQSQTINPTVPTIYTVIANNGSCSFTSTLSVIGTTQCCQATNYISVNALSGGTIGGFGSSTAINHDITINGNVSFSGEFLIAPNVSITIVSGGTLTSVNRAIHLYACNSMWSGIVVNNGGRIKLTGLDLIEDAVSAITCDGSTNTSNANANCNIDLSNGAVFNKNLVAITIRNYTQPVSTSPFAIQNCIFTSRDLSSFINPGGWPSVNFLIATSTPTSPCASPYTLQGFMPSGLKPPYAGQQPTGIVVQNSGVTSNPGSTLPTFYTILIGSPTNTFNLFDNMFYGIHAINSNVASQNNVFQNSRYLNGTTITQGAGIFATNLNTNALNYLNSLNLVSPTTPTVTNNKFYDCHMGLKCDNIYNVNLQYAEFYSTQSSLISYSAVNPGNFAIKLNSNKANKYIVSNNKFYNVRTGIYLSATYGALHIPGMMSNGLYWGDISISTNYFSPTINPFGGSSNEFIENGIVIENFLSFGPVPTTYFAGNGLRITSNVIIGYNGIRVSNFLNVPYINSNSNTILLRQNTPASQSCIRYEQTNFGIVRYNTLLGFSTPSASPVSGFYSTMSQMGTVQCNNASTLSRDFQFASGNNTTYWRNNTMQSSGLGLALTNTGFISPQGNANMPNDNIWAGNTWNNGSSCTYVDGTSKAYNNLLPNPLTNPGNSLLWVRNTSGGYIPTSNSGSPSQSYAAPNAIKLTTFKNGYFDCPRGVWVGYANPANPPSHRGTSEAIVNDSLGYTDAATSEINKTNLFRLLDSDTTLMDSSATLYNFYHTEIMGNKGKLLTVEKKIALTCHYTSAYNFLQSISPNTSIEHNYWDYYNLLISYKMHDSLLPSENSLLFDLASRCPFIDGAVVYQARSLFNIVNNLVFNFEDDCDLENVVGERKILITEEQLFKNNYGSSISDYNLFPNPAIDELTIISKKESEKINITIVDVNRKLLLTKDLTMHNYQAEIKLNLINGVYFVILTNMDKERVVKKLIIAK